MAIRTVTVSLVKNWYSFPECFKSFLYRKRLLIVIIENYFGNYNNAWIANSEGKRNWIGSLSNMVFEFLQPNTLVVKIRTPLIIKTFPLINIILLKNTKEIMETLKE